MLQGGPLSVIDGVITPVSGVITPVTHFERPFIEVITPFITDRGPPCVNTPFSSNHDEGFRRRDHTSQRSKNCRS